ncbi:MAG: hypothetical protein V1735_02045 [Nanoarchaeota archaeon]
MRNIRYVRNAGIALLCALLLLVVGMAFMTYDNERLADASPFLAWAMRNHLWIMAGMVFVSVAFGFVFSAVLYGEARRRRQESRTILDIVLLFLGKDERAIIHFLVKNKGETNQREISRLPGMNRVKAFRALQKMQEKRIIEVIPHGKVRIVKLTGNILSTLLEEKSVGSA